MQSVPDLEPACERPRERGPVGVRDAAASRRRPDDQRPGAERRRLLDARDDRHASSDTHAVRRILARARRVHDRNDRERRVTQDPDGGLGGCGRELALGDVDVDVFGHLELENGIRKTAVRLHVRKPDDHIIATAFNGPDLRGHPLLLIHPELNGFENR